MILITSASFINNDLQNEFGKIPSSFLPLGQKRLYNYQIEALKRCFPNEDIIISLPKGYTLNNIDRKIFEDEDITIQYNDNSLSLKESIFESIKYSTHKSLVILHGDTFIDLNIDKLNGFDLIGISSSDEEYDWEEEAPDLIWNGFFSFSSLNYFRECLQVSLTFVEAVKKYDKKIKLERTICSTWLDFGHTNLYFKSRTLYTTERSFNKLQIKNNIVTKKSSNKKKMEAEYQWFKYLPPSLQGFTPKVLSSKGNTYEIEYLPLIPLNELYVFGNKGLPFWKKIFNTIQNWFHLSLVEIKSHKINHHFKSLITEKTIGRINQYPEWVDTQRPLNFNDLFSISIRDLASNCIILSNKLPIYESILHGDLCLSNILYNSRSDSIKLIDPRGYNYEGAYEYYGNPLYDLAKLAHSIVGGYDYVISGQYQSDFTEKYLNIYLPVEAKDPIQKYFLETIFMKNFKTVDIIPLSILLFLSMIPLHSDSPDKQKAFIACAYRLWHIYTGG